MLAFALQPSDNYGLEQTGALGESSEKVTTHALPHCRGVMFVAILIDSDRIFSQQQAHDDDFHKDLFPLDTTDIMGLTLACLGLMVAAVRTKPLSTTR